MTNDKYTVTLTFPNGGRFVGLSTSSLKKAARFANGIEIASAGTVRCFITVLALPPRDPWADAAKANVGTYVDAQEATRRG